jgi:hypothetical protein
MAARSVEGAVQASRRSGKRRDAAQWAQVIATQRQSELTVVEFCRRRGIAKATFWYWSKRLVTKQKRAPVQKMAQRFLALPLVAPVAEPIDVEFGPMRVRLVGAAAARVVDAIVARMGSAAA